MSDRNLLHITQRDAFAAFCAKRGWVEESCKGAYEVLRMEHPKQLHPLIVYKKLRATEHLTVYDASERLATLFFEQSRSQRRSATHGR